MFRNRLQNTDIVKRMACWNLRIADWGLRTVDDDRGGDQNKLKIKTLLCVYRFYLELQLFILDLCNTWTNLIQL